MDVHLTPSKGPAGDALLPMVCLLGPSLRGPVCPEHEDTAAGTMGTPCPGPHETECGPGDSRGGSGSLPATDWVCSWEQSGGGSFWGNMDRHRAVAAHRLLAPDRVLSPLDPLEQLCGRKLPLGRQFPAPLWALGGMGGSETPR